MQRDKDIYQRFRKICRERNLIQPHDHILAALSGGPDSTALVDLFNRWRNEEPRLRLTACHYNHGLRTEADDEQRFVEEFCRNHSVHCLTGRGDVSGEAEMGGIAVHVAAREMRYDFLVDCAASIISESKRKERCVVVTGHHRDDQVETVLMRLFSGAGPEGLGGIRRYQVWKGRTDTPIVRPMLDFNRDEIEAYCRVRRLQYVIDRSNLDRTYPRNRLRHEVIPVIKSHFGEAALDGIIRSGEFSQAISEILDGVVDKAFSETLIETGKDEIVLDYDDFNSYLYMLRLNILQRAVRLLRSANDRIPIERYRTADRYLSTGKSGIIEMGGCIRIQRSGRKVFIYSSLEPDWSQRFSPDESVTIPGFGCIEARLKLPGDCPLPPPGDTLYCDFDKVGPGPYEVRPAENGDRIVPYGASGRRKVSDILREAGLPPHRRRYPVIIAAGQIAAVPPFRVADRFKLTDDTRQVVIFRLFQRAD